MEPYTILGKSGCVYVFALFETEIFTLIDRRNPPKIPKMLYFSSKYHRNLKNENTFFRRGTSGIVCQNFNFSYNFMA